MISTRARGLVAVGTAVLAATAATMPATAAAEPGATRVVSRTSLGAPADGDSSGIRLSDDGTLVAFSSVATTLVPGDANESRDVFVKNLVDDSVELVSLDEEGRQPNGHSHLVSLSANGRYVMFTATELVQGGEGTQYRYRLFLRDRTKGTSTPIQARGPSGDPVILGGGALSGNGRYYAFGSSDGLVAGDDNGASDVHRFDLSTGEIQRVSTGIRTNDFREHRWAPGISHNGRFIAFEFTAALVKQDRLRARDIYVRDMTERRPRFITQSSDGVQANRGSMAPEISANGRFVVYSSLASNLVRRDTNDLWDVFLHDRRTGVTERVSVNGRGRQGNAQSQAAAFWSLTPSVSRDGRFVVFGSFAGNFDPRSNDDVRNVFVRDRRDRTTKALSLTPEGTGANGDSAGVRVSANGSTAVFWSEASNLVGDDVNAVVDVFARPLGD